MIKSLKDLLDKFSRFTNSLVYDGGICKRLDNNVITSRGPATAMIFALEIVNLLCDEDTYTSVKNGLLVEDY